MSDSRELTRLGIILNSSRCKVKGQKAGPSAGPASHLLSRALSVRSKWSWAGWGIPQEFSSQQCRLLLPGLSPGWLEGQGPPAPYPIQSTGGLYEPVFWAWPKKK